MVTATPVDSTSYTTPNEKQSISDLATVVNLTKGDIPPPLVGASTTVLNHRIYVFGGRVGPSRQIINHLYILELSTLTWVRHIASPDSTAPPVPRHFHSATAYADRYIVIFGGMGNPNQTKEQLTAMDDICIFDTKTMGWTQTKVEHNLFSPQARYAHLATLWDSNKLVIMGGQSFSNQHIHDIHVFDLEKQSWIHGASIQGSHDSYRTITFGTQDDVYVYSNYNFSDINRDLVSFNPIRANTIKSHAEEMTGSFLPPGLRFPTGYVLGHYLIMSGTHLSANQNNFQVWVLDLLTYAWTSIDTGHHVSSGSWNRGILSDKKLYILGHAHKDLKEDYNLRRTNFDHIAIVNLEAFGVCLPPPPTCSPIAQELGLLLLNTPGLGDVVICTTDQQSIVANSTILSERWESFAELLLDDSPDSAPVTKKQLLFPENYKVTLAFLEFIYTDQIITEKPSVICRLLLLAEMYGIHRLKELATYALHQALSISTASLIYETATLTFQLPLQLRALKMMIHAKRIITKQIQQRKQKKSNDVSLSPSSSTGYLSDQEPISPPALSVYSSFSSLRRLASSSSHKTNNSLKSPPFNPVALKSNPSSLTSRS